MKTQCECGCEIEYTREDIRGAHYVLCGDATVITHVERLIAGKKADMVFTDPPFNIGVDYKTHKDNMVDGKYVDLLRTMLSNAVLSSADTPFYIMSSNKDIGLVHSLFDEVGIHFHQLLIWGKPTGALGSSDYVQNYEVISYGYVGKHRNVNQRGKLACEVFNKDGNINTVGHPTSRPVSLLEKYVGNSSNPGGIVLDLFLGSATTLIASEKLGRICYGMEIDPHYVDVCITRWENYTGRKAEVI